MKIIISPAKKMRQDPDSLEFQSFPVFLEKTDLLVKRLKEMDYAELKQLWKCNDQIAALNYQRIQDMDLHTNLTPAILSYEGIQYQHMAPGVFSDKEFDYIQNHLRILSGFYGVLKPMDGITPYRLEMQAKLRTEKGNDLYAFWSNLIAEHILSETDCVLNLASKEYSVSVSKYLSDDTCLVTCIFGEEKNGKVLEKGTLCKMARGEMVRYMAENQIESLEEIKEFNRLGFHFDALRSSETCYVFVR